MRPDLPRVEEALPAVRRLLSDAGVAYKLVGGLAVIHHGYERFTVDIDVLIERDALDAIAPHLSAHGFSMTSAARLQHDDTGVRVDLLRAGERLVGPRPAPPLPSPRDVGASESDPEIVALPALIEMKLDAGRRQDVTDVVQLLKGIEDGPYLHLEAAVRLERRAELAALRDEALEELRWESQNQT